MKSVLISIQPYWVFLIIAKKMGWNIDIQKTIEIRKNYPKDENWDKVLKIYCSKDKKSFSKIPKEYQPLMEQFLGKVIGEFVCDEIFSIKVFDNGTIQDYVCHDMEKSCVPYDDIANYVGKGKTGYGWHISDLKIYDEPKPLSDFIRCKYPWDCGVCDCWEAGVLACYKSIRPPQSWCYVEEHNG